MVLTAGSIAGVAWLAFRDGGGEGGDTGEVISARCNVTEAEDAGSGADPLDPAAPPERSLAVVQTNYGEIAVMLWGDLAPCGVDAFTHLAEAGFYANHECDRLTTQAVDPTAVLRCGSPGADPESDDSYGPGWRFQAETGMAGNDVADVLALVTDDRGRAGSAFALIRGAAVPTAGVSVIGGIVDGFEVLDDIAALSETVESDGPRPCPSRSGRSPSPSSRTSPAAPTPWANSPPARRPRCPPVCRPGPRPPPTPRRRPKEGTTTRRSLSRGCCASRTCRRTPGP
nr:hypothetical protein GCM10025732_07450 [Glycomyces mayteni]